MEVVNKSFAKELYNSFGFVEEEEDNYNDKSLYIEFEGNFFKNFKNINNKIYG